MSTDVVRGAGRLGFEAFGTACGLAVVVGALALLVPSFATLTVSLVALAVAGWASARRRIASGSAGPGPLRSAHALALALLAGATVLYFLPDDALAAARSLLLALAVVPLWVVERGDVGPGRRRGRS